MYDNKKYLNLSYNIYNIYPTKKETHIQIKHDSFNLQFTS